MNSINYKVYSLLEKDTIARVSNTFPEKKLSRNYFASKILHMDFSSFQIYLLDNPCFYISAVQI